MHRFSINNSILTQFRSEIKKLSLCLCYRSFYYNISYYSYMVLMLLLRICYLHSNLLHSEFFNSHL